MKRFMVATTVLMGLGMPLAHADVVYFTSTSNQITGIGAQFPTAFDTFTISGGSGPLTPGSYQSIAGLNFGVGYNCNQCGTAQGTLAFDLTVGSVTKTLSIGWSWTGGVYDYLYLTAPSPLTFVQSGGQTDVLTFSVPTYLTDYHENHVGSIYAVDQQTLPSPPAPINAVPEPVSLSLLGSGLIGISIINRRRTKRATIASAGNGTVILAS